MLTITCNTTYFLEIVLQFIDKSFSAYLKDRIIGITIPIDTKII